MDDLQPQNDAPPEVAELRALMTQIRTLETTILLDRLRWAKDHGVTFSGKRDEYEILGYDTIITYRQYRAEYDRGGIAGRIIDVMPDACWRGDPSFEIIEDEDPETSTLFEQAWLDLSLKHNIPSKLQRVDRLSRLSTYAVLLIGAPGNLDQPLPKGNGPEQVLYVMPFSGGGGPGSNSERNTLDTGAKATIFEFEDNPSNPRFGLPRSYKLNRTGANSDFLLKPVHWTRIIHVPERLLEDDVFGQPALERVWNLLTDLRKVTGGGSEAFWLRANQGMQMDLDKDMNLEDAKGTLDELRKQAEAYQHQLTRWIRTRGVKMNVLGSDVANFANPADAIITQIAGSCAIPKRILTGSEMGELASSQDRENFKDQINGRQSQHCAPNIVRPLVDRLIEFGYLPTPAEGPLEYQVKWPHIQVLTEAEKSAGALQWSQTKQGEDPIFTDAEIRDKWYAMPPLTDEQREEIADRKMEAIQRQQEAMAAAQPPAPPNAPQDEDEEELRAAQDAELLPVLAAAIATGDYDIVTHILGGPGSGNFGHGGRPGEVGGSSSSGGSSESRARFESRWPYGKELDAFAQKYGEKRLEQDLQDFWSNQNKGMGVPSYEFQKEVMQGGAKRVRAEARAEKQAERDVNKPKIVDQMKTKYGYDLGDTVYDTETGAKGVVKWGKDGQPYVETSMGQHYVGARWQKASRRNSEEQEGEEQNWEEQNWASAFRELALKIAGGPGSGNFGHAGRPGEVGGSSGGRTTEEKLQTRLDIKNKASEELGRLKAEYDRWTRLPQNAIGTSKEVEVERDRRIKEIHRARRRSEEADRLYSNTLLAQKAEEERRIRGKYLEDSESQDWAEAYRELALKIAGGPGSGNFGHAGRPGEVGGSASSGGSTSSSGDRAAARVRFRELKATWAHKNNELFKYIDTPDSPEAKATLNEMKALVKEMHKLDADPGGLEGIGLPGGPRDVVIIGGGPGGLSAAINGGAEGLDTLLIEGQEQVGGQARQSTRIENLPGFPLGVSGERLSRSMEEQSLRVGAEHKLGTKVVGMSYDPATDLKTLTLSNGETVQARTVILAGGLSQVNKAPWDVANSPDVSYGDPEKILRDAPGNHVVIAGGSNGAAQAAIACAENGAKSVTLVSRSSLDKSMSDYQINQVRNHERITPIVGDISKHSENKITLSDGRSIPAEKIGVFYGNAPDTKWLPSTIQTERGRVVTSHSHDFQTSMPGVFAVGDVTHNGAGRIGVAIGEGQSAVKGLFKYFESLRARTPKAAMRHAARGDEAGERAKVYDLRAWNAIVDQSFALDHEQPWYGQTVEGEKLPRRPTYLSVRNEAKIRAAGGPGSGNFGHSGRPGQVGGSAKDSDGGPYVQQRNPNLPIMSRVRAPKNPDPYAELPDAAQAARWRDRPATIKPETQREGLPFPYGENVSNIQGPANPNPKAELPERQSSLVDENYQSIETPVSVTASDEESLNDGDNINEVLKLTLDSGEELVFKPVDGEHFKDPNAYDEDEAAWIREDITNTDAPLAEREVLSYRVDEALGLGLTPKTVYGEYDGRDGALQDFVDDASDGAYGSNPHDQAKMGVFDAIIGNQDRHGKNAMVKDGELIAIDHGFTFGSNPTGGYIRSWALAGISPGDLSVDEQRALAAKLDNFDFTKVLKGSHLDASEIEAFRDRVTTVASRLSMGEAHLLKSDFDVSAW